MAMGRDSTQSGENPVNYVFDTPELCEHILSHLSTTDLIRTKRVRRRFDEVITSSPVLQENLFLRPRSNTVLRATLSKEPNQRLLIGSLSKQDLGATEARSESVMYEQHPILPHTRCPARPTTLIELITYQILYAQGTSKKNDPFVDFTRSNLYRSPVSHPENTYICEPPATDVEISLESYGLWDSINVHDEIGITFAMVHRPARKLVERDTPYHKGKKREMPEIAIRIRRAVVLNGDTHRRLQSLSPCNLAMECREEAGSYRTESVYSGQLAGRKVEWVIPRKSPSDYR
jgi:hypothetical protein